MRWRDRRQSSNIEDRRDQGGGFGGGLGGGFGGSRPRIGFPSGGRARAGGGLGIGAIVVILIIAWVMGFNPLEMLSGGGGSPLAPSGEQTTGRVGAPDDEKAKFISVVLGDTEDTWAEVFREQGRTYQVPTLVLFSGSTGSACGFANAAVGPFYCPGDQKVYIDLSFYDELATRFDAPGDMAEAYVIAHEVGHHVQNLLGILPKVDAARRAADEVEANQLSVRLELQADCFSGVWANKADKKGLIEVGDIDEALNAASQIGDDSLQKRSQGFVVPDSFTHGSAAQRSRWFKRGYTEGSIDACDTFGPSEL